MNKVGDPMMQLELEFEQCDPPAQSYENVGTLPVPGGAPELETSVEALCRNLQHVGIGFNTDRLHILRYEEKSKIEKLKSYDPSGRDSRAIASELLSTHAKVCLLEKILKALTTGSHRLHGEFLFKHTKNGRITMRTPCIQTMPNELRYRELVVPSYGNLLVCADFRAFDIHIAAALAEDKFLLECLAGNNSFYDALSEKLGCHLDAIPQISAGFEKVLFIGLLNGGGAGFVAQNVGCSWANAERVVSWFEKTCWGIARYRGRIFREYQPSGFFRPFDALSVDLRDLLEVSSPEEKQMAMRQAFSRVIQNSAARVFQLKLLDLQRELPDAAKLVLVVHDEVLIEVPESLAQRVLEIVQTVFEREVGWIQPDFRVSAGIGSSWAEAKRAQSRRSA